MSDATKIGPPTNSLQKPLPAWVGAGIVGIALGVGGTLMVMRYLGLDSKPPGASEGSAASNRGGGGPPAGMMGGPPGGGPMGGMMGGMGGGFGGGPRSKRNLTSLVGRLELLTRSDLRVALTPEQSSKFAAQLTKLEQLETMTEEDAQKELEALEGLLSPEQKAVADAISLPFAGRGGGGGGPGGGGPGGGGGMMGMGRGPDDENPFKQEANQKRLHDLLVRIQPAALDPSAKPAATGTPSAPAATEDPGAAPAAEKKEEK